MVQTQEEHTMFQCEMMWELMISSGATSPSRTQCKTYRRRRVGMQCTEAVSPSRGVERRVGIDHGSAGRDREDVLSILRVKCRIHKGMLGSDSC